LVILATAPSNELQVSLVQALRPNGRMIILAGDPKRLPVACSVVNYMVRTYSLEQAEEGIPEHGECAFPGCSHDVIVGRDTVLSGVLARAL
jgi:protein-L-isoaspartate O-methyltransferase